jgi:hypothetical protein
VRVCLKVKSNVTVFVLCGDEDTQIVLDEERERASVPVMFLVPVGACDEQVSYRFLLEIEGMCTVV